jgi:DNA-binding NarL/FixJ family response regulator
MTIKGAAIVAIHPVPDPAAIRILVVDDHHDLCELLEMVILSEPGMYLTKVLHRADSVIEELDRQPADVVLIDLNMPGRPPLPVIGEIRTHFPGTRIIAFSAYDDQESVNSALQAGASGYISKMQGLQSIMSGVRRVAGGQRDEVLLK